MKSRTAELLKAHKIIDGLNGKLKEAQQKNKGFDKELRQEKNMWELSISNLIGELNKTKEELQKAHDRLKLAETEL